MVAVTPADKQQLSRFCREHDLDIETVQGVVLQENGTLVGHAYYQITDQLEVLAVTSPVIWQGLLVRSLLNIGRLKGLDTAVFHCPLPGVFPAQPAVPGVDTPMDNAAYTAPDTSEDTFEDTSEDTSEDISNSFTISIPDFFENSGCKSLQ